MKPERYGTNRTTRVTITYGRGCKTMNAFDELTNQIKATEEIIEVCKGNHEALGLPDYISELEIGSLH